MALMPKMIEGSAFILRIIHAKRRNPRQSAIPRSKPVPIVGSKRSSGSSVQSLGTTGTFGTIATTNFHFIR
jgi:hypothetical protein